MIRLKISNESTNEGLFLMLPATPAELAEAFSCYERIGIEPETVSITEVSSDVPSLAQYIMMANIHDSTEMKKLNALAESIDRMTDSERKIFSGALDASSINSFDDVLSLSKSMDNYVLFPNVRSHAELGRYLVDRGYKNFPEEVQPYLNYHAIGLEYYSDNGGAYGPDGYVRHKNVQEQMQDRRSNIITLHLISRDIKTPCRLILPADEEELDNTKKLLRVEDFAEATIVEVEFGKPYLDELIPKECPCMEDANELALGIEEFEQIDGAMLEFLAVMSIEHAETMSDALRYAMNMHDYERITDSNYEYGKRVLRRYGAGDRLIEAMEEYTDFERLGMDAMEADGVRQTQFGLIRRISSPFPKEKQSMQIGGM